MVQNDSYQVVMPKLGLTMTEATLVEWLKEDGDTVAKGEVLFVLESEKSTLEIEAPASGTLQVLVTAGETVPVHQTVALLVPVGAKAPQARQQVVPSSQPPQSTDETRETRRQARESDIIPASPRARARARQIGVSLEALTGSGVRGMIVTADVEQAAVARPTTAKVSPVAQRVATRAGVDLSTIDGSGPGGRIMRADVEETLSPATRQQAGEIQPFSGLRTVIAERLVASWHERPHVTLTTEADATNLISARQQIQAETGAKLSYNALLVALVARALRDHPYMNVRLTDEGIEHLPQIHLGLAVDTERGLLVPVVRDAGTKTLLEIQQDIQGLVERALAGRSLPDDLSGGTFTLTNLGAFEIDAFTPIINPPESAILGVGRIVAKPVAVDRQVVVRDMMVLSLSFDHRLIDGAPAARFLQRVKQLVERPFALALPRAEGS